jgi:hypothetical protein
MLLHGTKMPVKGMLTYLIVFCLHCTNSITEALNKSLFNITRGVLTYLERGNNRHYFSFRREATRSKFDVTI